MFDGGYDYMSVDFPFSDIVGEFTAEVVFKCDEADTNSILIYQGPSNSNGFGGENEWQLGTANNDTIGSSIFDDSYTYDLDAAHTFTDEIDKHHIVMTAENYDGANTPTVSQFLDGNKSSTVGTGTIDISGIDDYLYIGSPSSTNENRNFHGDIYEIRISNIKRTDAWITASNESLSDSLLDYESVATSSYSSEIKCALV